MAEQPFKLLLEAEIRLSISGWWQVRELHQHVDIALPGPETPMDERPEYRQPLDMMATANCHQLRVPRFKDCECHDGWPPKANTVDILTRQCVPGGRPRYRLHTNTGSHHGNSLND